jgi:hypothetical protein
MILHSTVHQNGFVSLDQVELFWLAVLLIYQAVEQMLLDGIVEYIHPLLVLLDLVMFVLIISVMTVIGQILF